VPSHDRKKVERWPPELERRHQAEQLRFSYLGEAHLAEQHRNHTPDHDAEQYGDVREKSLAEPCDDERLSSDA
jgi:hypothetical protein